jgi:hypothetical protein
MESQPKTDLQEIIEDTTMNNNNNNQIDYEESNIFVKQGKGERV